MPSKKIKKARKTTAGQQATTDLHSALAKLNFHDVFRFHGERPRGSDFHPSSTLFEGRFGRMFRTLPAAEFAEGDLNRHRMLKLISCQIECPASTLGQSQSAAPVGARCFSRTSPGFGKETLPWQN